MVIVRSGQQKRELLWTAILQRISCVIEFRGKMHVSSVLKLNPLWGSEIGNLWSILFILLDRRNVVFCDHIWEFDIPDILWSPIEHIQLPINFLQYNVILATSVCDMCYFLIAAMFHLFLCFWTVAWKPSVLWCVVIDFHVFNGRKFQDLVDFWTLMSQQNFCVQN